MTIQCVDRLIYPDCEMLFSLKLINYTVLETWDTLSRVSCSSWNIVA